MDCVVEGSNPSHKFCDSMGLYGNSVGRVHKKLDLKSSNGKTCIVCGSNPHTQNMLLSLAQWSQNAPPEARAFDTIEV